jgi:hypothetical protein
VKRLSRRHVLRGAGVALALPWLESLAPRRARAQAAPARNFVAIYFPLGTPNFWTPATTGTGPAWQLSPILDPLTPVKSQVTVLGRVDQTVYAPNGVTPSNGPLTGSYLTAVKCSTSSPVAAPTVGHAGISIDQRVAQLPAMAAPVPSLQLGLATQRSYCDGTPCELSRSISWKDANTPLYKVVNPQKVFDAIVSGTAPQTQAAARAAGKKSVLDFVLANATSLDGRLGRSDRARMDEFLTSVRDLEQRVVMTNPGPSACGTATRPTLSADVDAVPAGYSRDDHANVMMDLIVLALSCGATRVVSLMLDDARSDFVYDFQVLRTFTPSGSTATSTPLQYAPVNYANSGRQDSGWATVVWWYVSKLSRLCQKLAATPDAGGKTLLDSSVVWFGSGQNEEWDWTKLPVLYVGSGGGLLKVDQFVPFSGTQSLGNVYFTFLTRVFGLGSGIPDQSFGNSTGVITELLA